ncbi:MAG: histidinol dehydrogenase [Bacteroidota bacterium]
MKIVKYPPQYDWDSLCERPGMDVSELQSTIDSVFEKVRKEGDAALLSYAKKFDGVDLHEIEIVLKAGTYTIDSTLQSAIKLAKTNIEKFHRAQRDSIQEVETTRGVYCWRKSVPIQNVGLYIPGGSAPLFSTLLMLAIPAQLAKCKNIVVCTPPSKDGKLNEVIGWTCQLLGIEKIYLVGGAQAVAAMTFGTDTMPKVDKIFGPGNQFVTAAKQTAQQYKVAIDMPAGPSEVLVIADTSAKPTFVAADLLSQAEHGPDSQVVLVSDSEELINEVEKEVEKQVSVLPREEMARQALKNSTAILLHSVAECVKFSNHYAPEHLIISTEDARSVGEEITIAGSVFLGNWSCESAGDYASGTNHTLPTNGYARNYSGVSLDSFVKKITFQELKEEGLQNIGPAVEKMAAAEQLFAHKNAVTVRLNDLKKQDL